MRYLLLVLGLVLASGTVADADDLRVGAAAVNLKADDSMVIGGSIGPGKATGQEGELRVVAVVVEKPQQATVAIVACDVLFVSRDFVDSALAEIEKTVGIPASHVLVNATHTHHAPSTGKLHGYDRDEVFCRRVREGIVQAVQEAHKKLNGGSSTFHFHLAEESTIGQNSRLLLPDKRIYWIGPRDPDATPTGPFDPQLPVLSFRDPQGKLQAAIYNHSTHTIGTLKGGVRSPSFYGLAAQGLEPELGGVVCFLEGASGSTHNLGGVSTAQAIERLQSVIRDALSKSQPRAIDRVVSIKRPFTFKVRYFDENVEDEKVSSYTRQYAPGIAEYTIDVFREMRRELKPQQGQERETWLQAMRIGDVAIVGVPAEYFTSLGVDIKKRSPFKHTYVAELANDWIGYLPDQEGHRLGGYQTWTGLHSYAEPGTGEQVADEVVKMLDELHRGAKE